MWLGTVEQRLVVGAVVVIITATLLVLLTEADHGQRLVPVAGIVLIVIGVAIRVGVCP